MRKTQVGVQLTAGINVIGGDALGIQFAGVANLVRKNAAGLAMSTALNLVGGQSWGFHLAALDVVHGSFRGAQWSGLTSFSGGRMTGMQISAGLALGVGIDPFHERIRWSYGGGFGTHIPLLRNFYLDLDFLAHAMQPDITRYDGTYYHVMAELRLLVGWQLLPRFGVFAGPTVHASVTNDPCCEGAVSLLSGGERIWQSGPNLVRLGPGLAIGIRAF